MVKFEMGMVIVFKVYNYLWLLLFTHLSLKYLKLLT